MLYKNSSRSIWIRRLGSKRINYEEDFRKTFVFYSSSILVNNNNNSKNITKIMSRKITISKYEGNTQWSVEVEDSYGKLYHLGYWINVDYDSFSSYIEEKAKEIWKNEVKPKKDLMNKAITECIQMDIDRGVEPSLD